MVLPLSDAGSLVGLPAPGRMKVGRMALRRSRLALDPPGWEMGGGDHPAWSRLGYALAGPLNRNKAMIDKAVEWQPDRDPKYWGNCIYGHGPGGTKIGLSEQFARPGGVQLLVDRFERVYDLGVRTMIVWIPSGSLAGGPFTSSVSAMSELRLDEWADTLGGWRRARPDARIILGMGYRIALDPDRLSMFGAEEPNPDHDWRHQEFYGRTLGFWIRRIGIDGLIFDNASSLTLRNLPSTLATFAYLRRVYGLPCGGEAFPLEGLERPRKLSKRHTAQASWLALERDLVRSDPDGGWKIDPETTELNVIIKTGKRPTPADFNRVLGYIGRGFLPCVGRCSSAIVRLIVEASRRAVEEEEDAV